jgi:hypothetical protein
MRFKISVSEATYERLRNYLRRGETLEDAIIWLLDFAEGKR